MGDFVDFKTVCARLPIGIMILDREYRVRYWNSWLEEKTAMAEGQVCGQRLEDIYAGWKNERFNWAVSQAISYKIPQILSQALNRYLIPIKVARASEHGLPLMQQQVSVMPIGGEDGQRYALVIIQDVTETVIRSSAMNEMVHKFREVSLRDPLTNLFNRRFMWEWLGHHIKEAQRYSSSLACMMLDIDHFKVLNDTYGHDVGDEILKAFAALVSQQLRESDILVRYGGEEFCAFLPKCSLYQATTSAQRVLELVRTTSLGGLPAGEVTCSIGVAIYDSQHKPSADTLIKLADERLYEAKKSGRDRVVSAEDGWTEGGQ